MKANIIMFPKSYRNIIQSFTMIFSILIISACSNDTKQNHYEQAQTAFQDNKFYEARIYLLNTLRNNPTDIKSNALFADVALQLSDGDSALSALEKLPEDHEDLRALKSHASILKGRINDVINSYDVIDAKNYTAEDWRMLSWALFEREEAEKAFEILESALKHFPKNSDLLALLGNYYLTKSNNNKALDYSINALKFDEDNYEALNLAARASLRLNQIDKAKEYYFKAYEAYPDNPIPAINLAGIALDEKDIKTAKPYLEQAEQINAALPFTKFIKARYAHLTGDNALAKEILMASNSGLENFEPAIFLAGKVAYELGDHQVAAARLRRSLAAEPNNDEARRLLTKIEQ